MKSAELIDNINKSVEDLDFVTARKYIEGNLSILQENLQLLKSNAREIYNFLNEQEQLGVKLLSRKDLSIINAVNAYAYKFDLRGIKLMLKENAKLFLRDDVIAYLNSDAKTILTGMGAINSRL
ncbi:hypothetical protein ACE38V_19935 [Cytobacillus sp. Hz8]|uniref:hypothetical protein n=1 Tax=Cytobacillus sp. Hz8 TaxID=3347168 RepID=UPI0035DBC533